MLDIGGLELLIIAVVALLVIGPERMPEALRTIGLWLGRLRRSFTSVKAEIEKEIGMDEVKRQLHNESVMAEMKRIEEEVQRSVNDNPVVDPALEQASGDIAHQQEQEQENSILPPTAQQETDTPSPTESSAEKPRPRTEAEVEAAYERKMRAQRAAGDDN